MKTYSENSPPSILRIIFVGVAVLPLAMSYPILKELAQLHPYEIAFSIAAYFILVILLMPVNGKAYVRMNKTEVESFKGSPRYWKVRWADIVSWCFIFEYPGSAEMYFKLNNRKIVKFPSRVLEPSNLYEIQKTVNEVLGLPIDSDSFFERSRCVQLLRWIFLKSRVSFVRTRGQKNSDDQADGGTF